MTGLAAWHRVAGAPAAVLLAGAIGSEVLGTLCLKASLEHRGLYVVTAVGYSASFVFLALVLRAGMPLGVAYGVWAACGVVLTVGLSALIFGEPITPTMIVGITLVVMGVLAVELGSPQAEDVGAADDAETETP